MNPQQRRRAKAQREYKKARDEYLEAHPHCEIQAPGCTGRATEISHIVGRARGGALSDPSNFEAACRWCGDYVERNKKWALETGHHAHGFRKVGES